MAKTSSSVLWIARRYAHSHGTAERHQARIAELEKTRNFHQAAVDRAKSSLVAAGKQLRAAEKSKGRAAAVLELHDLPLDVSALAAIRPHEWPRTTSIGCNPTGPAVRLRYS